MPLFKAFEIDFKFYWYLSVPGACLDFKHSIIELTSSRATQSERKVEIFIRVLFNAFYLILMIF